jgi:predicted O-methyltransferase YrrM
MILFDQKTQNYIEKHSRPESEVLQELNRETNLKVVGAGMLSGQLQGSALAMFVALLQAKNILEIGTYTGYSAIWMAGAMPEGGKLHTIDKNEELEDMVRRYFEKAGLTDKIVFHIGNALDIIPTLHETFDLVYIDADKENYLNYYEMVMQKTRKGGLIIADNVLWHGKVISPEENTDKATQAILDFNTHVHNDKRVENVLFPIRDGLMVARKL